MARRPVLVSGVPERPLQVTSFSCAPVADIPQQSLGLTYWFDAAPRGEPYPVTIAFSGQRIGLETEGGPRDAFDVHRTVHRVIPGSGSIAVTARVTDVEPGQWQVTAAPVIDPAPGVGARGPLARALRSMPTGSATGATGFAPVIGVRAPGVRLGAWPALVGIGAVVAVTVLALLGAQGGLAVGRLVLIAAVACLLGLLGAKVYYLLTHREEKVPVLTAGMSIQGFVLAAIATMVVGSLVAGVPVGAMLDVITPGLLFGMSIGRIGCLLGGCCVGHPTASRWGIWSSDRHLGVRRVPVQLFESTLAGVLAVAALLTVVLTDPRVDGLVFSGFIAAYTFGRQLLFPIRGIPRMTPYGRPATMAVMGLVMIGTAAVALLA